MFGRKVFIRNDYWLTCDSFKKPEMYIGEVVSKKSKLNSRGKVEWMVELYDWKNSYYWISEDELARSKKELNDRISKRKQKDDYEDNDPCVFNVFSILWFWIIINIFLLFLINFYFLFL